MGFFKLFQKGKRAGERYLLRSSPNKSGTYFTWLDRLDPSVVGGRVVSYVHHQVV